MNTVQLIGNLVADLEVKQSQAGKTIAKGTIAVRRDKEKSDFIRIVAFGKTAEMLSEYFSKGSQIAVTGTIWTGSYEKEDGSKVYTTDVCVNSFTFLNSKKEEKPQTTKPTNKEPDEEFPF